MHALLLPLTPFCPRRSLYTLVFGGATQVGTDIQDNKCSWLVVQALERASPEQKAVLVDNYAIDEEDKVRVLLQNVVAPPAWRYMQ